MRDIVRSHLGSEDAVGNLREYFGLAGGAAYTGARFEHLGGGGDRVGVADVVTAEDLVAVQMLSVTVPERVSLDLLEGDLGQQMSKLLREIPCELDMVDAEAEELESGSAAEWAWDLLDAQYGVGWVKAGKLLARKRPRLLPVYDRVVRCVLGSPSSFWLDLHRALRADGRALHHELLDLRERAGVPKTVSALRVCDVVLWMAHHEDHRPLRCPGHGTLSV
ncbi:DUF6308 family protein [Streptomyces bauhiniae]|uniref:DUF6308 family protein n=1 Tax=Streptomyces bauhiniae TaxID=2340725 RepID=UPI001EF328E8|nr:DUF6308 family protein [Streptomyces bauhiniae]